MSYTITNNGKELDSSLYVIDEENKTFSSKEDGLVLDFSNESGWTFNTGSGCTFDTLNYCTFDTLNYCTFKTGYNCTFNTLSNCTFNVWYDIKSIKLIKDSCIVLRLYEKTEVIDLNYYIENNPKLENFEMDKPSKEALELLSTLSSNNDFMLNLRKPNVQTFMEFCNE